MKLFSLLSAAALSVALSTSAQAATGQEYVCEFKAATKVDPKRAMNIIPGFLVLKVNPQNPKRVQVTDQLSLAFNGAASQGVMINSANGKVRFTWVLQARSSAGAKFQIIYNLKLNPKSGKATLTAGGQNVVQGLYGRGSCVLNAIKESRRRSKPAEALLAPSKTIPDPTQKCPGREHLYGDC